MSHYDSDHTLVTADTLRIILRRRVTVGVCLSTVVLAGGCTRVSSRSLSDILDPAVSQTLSLSTINTHTCLCVAST